MRFFETALVPHQIQNDVIAFMADMMTESVAEDVKSADVQLFSLMADGSRNKRNVENLSIAPSIHTSR